MSDHVFAQLTSRRAGWLTGGGAAAALVALMTVGGWRTADVAASPAHAAAVAASSVVQAPVASYAGVVDKVAPSVVTIRVEKRAQPMPTGLPDLGDLFGPGFRLPEQPRSHERGLGSGVIVRADGYVLTNNHVVEDAEKVRVELPDRRVLDGKVVGTDPASDLAVVKLDARDLHALPLGDSDRVRVGDVVLALGNPLGVGQTVTMGIVSGKGRRTGNDDSFEDFIQTDAAINQGNSGGALVDLNGELVGINSQILTPTGGNIGVGFAIPANMARSVMEQLITTGRVHRAKLGVTAQTITGDLAESLGLSSVNGALVSAVEPGSPADRAGIRRGDVIVEVDGKPVADSNALRNEISSTRPGSAAHVTVLRDGARKTMDATLGELPSARRSADRDDRGDDHGKFGMAVEPVTPDIAAQLDLPRTTNGVVITGVDPSGAAADAGLREGDVIVQASGKDVRPASELRAALEGRGDRPSLLLVNRHGTTIFVTMRSNG